MNTAAAAKHNEKSPTEIKALLESFGINFSMCVKAFGMATSGSDFVSIARTNYLEQGRIEFDDTPVVSESENGAYVSAWVWVDQQKFTSEYKCPKCEHEWNDVWTATCDDDCPACGERHISPIRSFDANDKQEIAISAVGENTP